MEKWPKEKLILEITHLQEKLSFYEKKLRDLVIAYKSLVKEKEALESSVKALQNVCQSEKQSSEASKANAEGTDIDESESASKEENVKETKNESIISADVTTLMNSLATLSVEKSRMEASFQADKKLLRQEKERNESHIRDLQDKLKKLTYESTKELEQLKSRLIIEKHEREKEQNDHLVMISELQQLLSQERQDKVTFEKELSELTPKFQLLVNKEEVERHKEIDMTEKFVDLQKKHLEVLEEERKRMLQAEQDSKEQIAIHERRVANLETRLTELSLTVANYHRLRQEDQNEITKLKAHIADSDSQKRTFESQEEIEFDLMKNKSEAELTAYVKSLMNKMTKYKTLLENASQHLGKNMELNTILCDNCNSIGVHSVNLEVHRKLLTEYESLMQKFKESSKTVDEIENLEIKIQVLQDRNSVLTHQIEDTVRKYEKQLETLQEQLNTINLKHSKELDIINSTYKTQVIELENQLKKQRDRTLALLDEKEQEVSTLKSSFQIFLPGSQKKLENPQGDKHSVKHSQLTGVLDDNFDSNVSESPHILHYAHELARRDVDITNMRKACNQLEQMVHKVNKELVLNKEKNMDEINRLKEEVSRLEKYQTHDGVNLEYLKNVIVNYFLSQSSSRKRHMFNAIATILKFSDAEIQTITINDPTGVLK